MNKPDWFPDWQDECVAIVAAGPSINQADVDKLRDRIHVVAINESYKLCKWADILYSCDDAWWRLVNGAKDFPALKISQDKDAVARFPDIKRIKVKLVKGIIIHDLLMDEWGEVGGGGNSGFQCINLLAQSGVTAIALLGFDMCNRNGQIHWHGRHPSPMNNPIEYNYQQWRDRLHQVKPKLDVLGIDIVNCSPISTLQYYPRVSVDEMLARWGL